MKKVLWDVSEKEEECRGEYFDAKGKKQKDGKKFL
jgi:hypothetical protein